MSRLLRDQDFELDTPAFKHNAEDGLPDRWVSIDPGDRHVAMAVWHGATCMGVDEYKPREAIDTIREMFEAGNLDLVVFEKFALQPHRALDQTGSEFRTSQLIGQLKLMCDVLYAVPWVGYFPSEHKALYGMDWYKALSLKDKRGLAWWGKGTSDHCKDAWCVGAWFKHDIGEGQYTV